MSYEKRIFHHTEEIYQIVYVPSRQLVLANSDDKRVSVWDSQTMDLLHNLEHDSGLFALYLSPD